MSAMTNDLTARLLDALATDDDHMIASGDDLVWLMAQLACWPIRVDKECTTNDRFLRMSAAATLNRQDRVIEGLREALEKIELQVTNHGGWFEQDPFGEYAKLGDIAKAALSRKDPNNEQG